MRGPPDPPVSGLYISRFSPLDFPATPEALPKGSIVVPSRDYLMGLPYRILNASHKKELL